MQQTQASLQQARTELLADLGDKRQGLAIDTACVGKAAIELDKCYSRKAQGKAVLPELVATPRDDSAGRVQERQRQHATLNSLDAAVRAEQAARESWKKIGTMLDRCQGMATAIARATHAQMAAKVEHTELLRQELLKQGKLTEQKLAEAQRALGATAERLRALESPLASNEKRSRLRDQRAERENVNDEVSEALHTQQHTLKGKQLQLESQASALQTSIGELQAAHKTIMEDVADKDKALAIDRACAAAKSEAQGNLSFGFSKVGQGQRHFADTTSSKMRQMPASRVTGSLVMA